jgi:molecular chaperone GrpE
MSEKKVNNKSDKETEVQQKNQENKNQNDEKEKKTNMSEKKKTDEYLQEIESLKKENEQLKDKLMRKTAELDNVIKRCEKEKLEMLDYANEKLLVKLLDLVDDLAKAVEAGKESHDPDTILTGVELIYDKAMKLLDSEGVKPLESSVGKPFDVNIHDAMVSMPSEHPEGIVVNEVQKGYSYKDKVLRHSKVITSSGNGDVKEENNNE